MIVFTKLRGFLDARFPTHDNDTVMFDLGDVFRVAAVSAAGAGAFTFALVQPSRYTVHKRYPHIYDFEELDATSGHESTESLSSQRANEPISRAPLGPPQPTQP